MTARKEIGVMVGDWERGWLWNGRMEFRSIVVSPWFWMKTTCKAMMPEVGERKREVWVQ